MKNRNSNHSQIQWRLGLAFLLAAIAGGESVQAASSWSDRPAWQPATERASTNHRARDSRISRQEAEVTPFSPGSHNVAVGVGQIFLMGDLADDYSDNIGFRLHYTYGVSDIFGFDSSVGYSTHSEDQFSVMTALAGLRTNLNWYDKVVPYVVFGLGFYRPSYEVTKGETLSPFLFGIHLGPGVNLQLTDQFFFGTSLTFHDIFGTTRATKAGGSQEVGGTFISFLLHMGTTF